MTTTDLQPAYQADDMLAEREAVLAMVRQALETLHAADARAVGAGLGSIVADQWSGVQFSVNPGNLDAQLGRIRARLDNQGWARLLRVSGMRAWMDPQTTAQWDRDLRDGNTPPLEASTIEATFSTLAEQREGMFEQAVLQCYRRVSWDRGPERLRSWERKEEDGRPVALASRLVLAAHRGIHRWDANIAAVADLDRLLAVLDGKPARDHQRAMEALWEATWRAGRTEAATDYMHIRGFKNGSKHLTFLRPDLVARLNEMVSAMAPALLPAPAKYLKRGSGKALARAA